MKKTTKTLLTISLVMFALGFTDILWGIGRPFGAIFFGLFLVSKLLEKEVALFDQEQRVNLTSAQRYIASQPSKVPATARAARRSERLVSSHAQ